MRDELWKRALKQAKASGSIIQIWTDQTPQGFSYRQYGVEERRFIDVEGLSLIEIKRNSGNPAEPFKGDEISDPEEE